MTDSCSVSLKVFEAKNDRHINQMVDTIYWKTNNPFFTFFCFKSEAIGEVTGNNKFNRKFGQKLTNL